MVDVSKLYRFAYAFEQASVAPTNVDEIISGLWDGSPPETTSPTPAPAGTSEQKSGFEIPGYTRVTKVVDLPLQQKAQQLLPQVRQLPFGQGVPFTDPRTGQQYLAVHEQHGPRPGGRQDYHSGVSLFVPSVVQSVISTPTNIPARWTGGLLSENSEQKIAQLDPGFQSKVRQLLLQGLSEGLRPEIAEGYRSQERQNELYEQGRTTPGKMVTQTRHSMHTQGKAVDIAQLDESGKITYDATPGFWDRMGAIGKSLGLMWGGDWKGFKDRPHFQYRG